MSKKALLAGIACMASAVMADAKENETLPGVTEQETEDKVHVVEGHQQTARMNLLIEVLKTRMH